MHALSRSRIESSPFRESDSSVNTRFLLLLWRLHSDYDLLIGTIKINNKKGRFNITHVKITSLLLLPIGKESNCLKMK